MTALSKYQPSEKDATTRAKWLRVYLEAFERAHWVPGVSVLRDVSLKGVKGTPPGSYIHEYLRDAWGRCIVSIEDEGLSKEEMAAKIQEAVDYYSTFAPRYKDNRGAIWRVSNEYRGSVTLTCETGRAIGKSITLPLADVKERMKKVTK